LRNTFTGSINLSFNVLRTLSKEGKTSDEVKEYLRGLFDNVVLKKEKHIEKYLRIANGESKVVKTNTINNTIKPIKKEKKQKLPKHYGKKQIEADITKQNSPATALQNTGLAANKIKNVYLNLKNHFIHDYCGDGKKKLTEEQHRAFDALARLIEQKAEQIFKKK
jgi:hypothetical protein